VPICYREILELGPRCHIFLTNLLLRMRRNGPNSTSGHIKPKIGNPPWVVSYSTTNFGGAYSQIYVLLAKKAFAMKNLGSNGDGGDHFLRNPERNILG